MALPRGPFERWFQPVPTTGQETEIGGRGLTAEYAEYAEKVGWGGELDWRRKFLCARGGAGKCYSATKCAKLLVMCGLGGFSKCYTSATKCYKVLQNLTAEARG